MGKLITTSILDSYDWLMNCPQSFRAAAFKDFTNQLNRVDYWDKVSPAIKRGVAFEKKVCSRLWMTRDAFLATIGAEHTSDIVRFWDLCHEGELQAKLSKTMTIDGIDYYCYGKADVALATETIDIKTTKEFKGHNYLDKNQHPMYCMIRGIPKFTYLIAVCSDDPNPIDPDNPKTICTAVKELDCSIDPAVAEARIRSKIQEFVSFLGTDQELLQAYNTKFCREWK